MEKIKILLAEDHVVVREGTRELIQHEDDMEVVGEAGDGEEAVELATQTHPDVIIMDVNMPKLNGIEATKQIKVKLPSTAILILSAYDNDQYISALLEAGAAGYLLKNIKGKELIDAVRAVHAGESVLHPKIARKVLNRLITPGSRIDSEPAVNVLSERELEVLKLAARGLNNRDIADQLFLSIRTVQAHLGNIFNKLDVGSRTEAILVGLKKGWFSVEDLS
ncbi:MAG TPA: response regulator transcription factor [Dehalococcoidales bacterium]|nr:response regulator transcription factor [Dehalococcoidales bacterium]